MLVYGCKASDEKDMVRIDIIHKIRTDVVHMIRTNVVHMIRTDIVHMVKRAGMPMNFPQIVREEIARFTKKRFLRWMMFSEVLQH